MSGGRQRQISESSRSSSIRVSSWLFAISEAPDPVLDFGPERGPGKGTMADLGPLIRHLVSTRLPSGGRKKFGKTHLPHFRALREKESEINF